MGVKRHKRVSNNTCVYVCVCVRVCVCERERVCKCRCGCGCWCRCGCVYARVYTHTDVRSNSWPSGTPQLRFYCVGLFYRYTQLCCRYIGLFLEDVEGNFCGDAGLFDGYLEDSFADEQTPYIHRPLLQKSSTLQGSGSFSNKSLQSRHTVTHCNTLQHTATHCNTLQHTRGQKCPTKTELIHKRDLTMQGAYER